MDKIPTILVDMDDVLVQFGLSSFHKMNEWLARNGREQKLQRDWRSHADWDQTAFWGVSDEVWWSVLDASEEFWSEMPVLPWAQRLLDYLREHARRVVVCTSPPAGRPHVAALKTTFLEQRLGLSINDISIIHDKHLLSRVGTLLVDDNPRNVRLFKRPPNTPKAGGEAVQVPAAWNTANVSWSHVHSAIDPVITAYQHRMQFQPCWDLDI